jgi:hypothetical protein
MRRHLTGYIAFCAISRDRSILQLSAPRTEKPHAPHFDFRKKTSFCTTGFRIKSYSLNSIHHSFGRATSHRNEANRRPLSNCRNTLAKKSHQEHSFISARFQAIRHPKPVFLLASARSGDRLSRHFRPLRQLPCCTA